MSFSIYDLDEDIRKLLSLDNFLGGLSVTSFIEELSKDHFLKSDKNDKLQYMDPKPYIRTFESTLRELKKLMSESERQKDYSQREADKLELKSNKEILSLNSNFESIHNDFDNLDKKISVITSKINPLGKKLSKITSSRDRSTETIFLIRCYHGFYTKEKYEPLDQLKNSKKFDDQLKCASVLSELLILAKRIESDDLMKTVKTTNLIQKFCEVFENAILSKFEIASQDNSFDLMKQFADILYNFNNATSIIQTFISNNDLLLIDDEVNDDNLDLLENEPFWITLSDPSLLIPVKDDSTKSLLDKLRISIKGQTRIVLQVFQNPIPVLKIFIQRIYAQIIHNKINTILQYSLTISSLAHVRILHALYNMVSEFSKDVKDFLNTNEFDKENELINILDQSFEDLFIEYSNDMKYFTREKKNLEDLIYKYVHKYNLYHERALANGHLSEKLDSLDNEFKTQDSNNALTEKKRLYQFKAYVKTLQSKVLVTNRNSDLQVEKIDDELAKLNITVVETVLKCSIESIARMLEICPNKSTDHSLEILEILIFDFGKLYIGGALEVCYDQAKQASALSNSSSPIDFDYLHTFTLVSEVLYLISSSIKKIILPCALNSPNIKNRMINLTNAYIKRCELSLNIILNETLETIANRVTYLLSKQKKKDFQTENIEEDTEACELVSEFLEYVHSQIKTSLNNTNLQSALIKIGMNTLNQLLEHYKKYIVGSTGGIVLTKDVIRYQSVIDSWQIEELTEHFQLLKEIANLFTVQSDLINSLITEGQLASLKPYTIKQYVSKRSDFNASYFERFFSLKT